jgi:hypothetical protein
MRTQRAPLARDRCDFVNSHIGPGASAEQALQYEQDLRGIEVMTHNQTVADLDGFAAEVEAADRI